MADLHTELEALGNSAKANKELYAKKDAPDPSVLERFVSPAADPERNDCNGDLDLYIEIPEFTSLCPLTGQPDFAKIVISYTPDKWCVESKSIKLYMGGYRNFGEFHESCTVRIMNDLVKLLEPKRLQVEGQFTPRGGIPFWPTATYVAD